MSSPQQNVAVAFALVIGAGAATALGAVVVFFPALVKHAQRKTLAAALGLSAGVMTYVSFAEIFLKSVDSFTESLGEKRAQMYATLCFFGGVLVMLVRSFISLDEDCMSFLNIVSPDSESSRYSFIGWWPSSPAHSIGGRTAE